MNTEHTPLPWEVHGGKYLPIVAIVDGKAAQIGRLESFGQISDEEVEANAEFLLRAVDCHEELLQACKAMLEYIHGSQGIVGWHLNGDTLDWDQCDAAQLIEAALTKAERETR